jgi:hypothetical protein
MLVIEGLSGCAKVNSCGWTNGLWKKNLGVFNAQF